MSPSQTKTQKNNNNKRQTVTNPYLFICFPRFRLSHDLEMMMGKQTQLKKYYSMKVLPCEKNTIWKFIKTAVDLLTVHCLPRRDEFVLSLVPLGWAISNNNNAKSKPSATQSACCSHEESNESFHWIQSSWSTACKVIPSSSPALSISGFTPQCYGEWGVGIEIKIRADQVGNLL